MMKVNSGGLNTDIFVKRKDFDASNRDKRYMPKQIIVFGKISYNY